MCFMNSHNSHTILTISCIDLCNALWFRPEFQLEILTLFYDVENKIRVFIPLQICFEVKMEHNYSGYWNYETQQGLNGIEPDIGEI